MKILHFKQFYKHYVFVEDGEGGRKKLLKNYIDVNVCIDMVCGDTKNSNILFDEQHIIANKTLAREIGLNEALILQQINYWIEINKKSGNNFYDERYWTYNSIRVWQEKDFDYMGFDTVKRTFANTNLIDVFVFLQKEPFLLQLV